MSAPQRIARVYAEALLNTAEQGGQAPDILQELASLVNDVFRADPQFEVFLSSGAMGRDHKAEVLRSIFADRASETLFNFLQVVNEHDRLDLLRPILAAYRESAQRTHWPHGAQVTSAIPLPDDQQETLRNELRETFQREPVLETQVDPELLGGLIVQVGDWLYDGSVRSKLATLRHEIIERSSHEIQSRRDRFCSANGN